MKIGIFLGFLLLPAVAQAAVVDFAPQSGRFTDLGTPDGFNAEGSWREDGFDVGFTFENIFGDGLGGVANAFNAGPALNDSGCCFGVFTSLSFSRPDAKAFSLREIDILQTTASYYGEVSFTPYAADGSLDTSRDLRREVAVAPANVVLKGTKSDGTEVSALINSYFNSNFIGGLGGPDRSFQNEAPYVLDDALAQTLSDLSVLDVTIGGAYSLGLDREEALGNILRTSLDITGDLDPFFSRGFEQCFVTGQSVRSCAFEGFGEFSFFYDTDRLGNYGSQVFFESFTFDDASAMAPVPLPATAPLLVAAIGLLGWRSRKTLRGTAAS